MPVDRTGSDASFEGGRHDVTRSLLWLVLHLVLERPRLLRRPERSALIVVLCLSQSRSRSRYPHRLFQTP